MEIIALKEYTDKYISLYEGEIRNVSSTLGQRLVTQGVVAQHTDNGSESGETAESNLLIVTIEGWSGFSNPSHTYEQMLAAYKAGKGIILKVLKAPEEYEMYQSEWCYLTSYYDSSKTFIFTYINIAPYAGGSYDNLLNYYRVICNDSNEWSGDSKISVPLYK